MKIYEHKILLFIGTSGDYTNAYIDANHGVESISINENNIEFMDNLIKRVFQYKPYYVNRRYFENTFMQQKS